MKGSAVVLFVGLICALLASGPARGDVMGQAYFGEGPPKFAIGLRLGWHTIDGIDASAGSYFGEDLGFDTDYGYGFSAEYWISPAISLELAFDHVKIEDTYGAAKTVALGIDDWQVSVKYTFMPNARLRPYVLGGLDVFLTDIDFGGTGVLLVNGDVDNSWGWHIGGGAEYRFTDSLGLFAEVRYRAGDTDVDVTQWFSGIPALTTTDPVAYDGFVGTIGLKIYW